MTHIKKYWWVYLAVVVLILIAFRKKIFGSVSMRAGGAIGGGGGHTGGAIIGGVTAFQTYPFGNATNSNINILSIPGKFNEDGTPAGGSNLKQKSCSESCGSDSFVLKQYPKDSPYYPYFQCWCRKAFE